jgi:putative membrane protein
MNRRNLMGGLAGLAAAGAVPFAATSAALAQTTVDRAKMPALMGGDFSTATSQLAARRASNRTVKAFAELEIAEQAAVAKAFGARPGATGVSRRHAAMIEELRALSGSAFDMMYVEGQITGHQELLKIHQAYARSGRDPQARGASIVGVTGIQSHLFLLNSIRSQLA